MALFSKRAQNAATVQPTQEPGTGGQDKADQVGAMLLQRPAGTKTIGDEDIRRAVEILAKYKAGKTNLENRIIEDEKWYQVQHSQLYTVDDSADNPRPTSAWLFNSLMNKHADAMDNYPKPTVLPREASDQETAKQLSSVLPCVLEQNDFEETYNNAWWEKLKHGTGVYFVGWDKDKEGGLGDVEICSLDLLNIFWEPGITDIQRSRNLFIVDLVDNEVLETEYPELQGKSYGSVIDTSKYIYEDNVDTSNKSLVVDWYYHIRNAAGQRVLHMCKFVGTTLLYSSQNEPETAETGIYDHGEYPVEFDTLFPMKGTPVGFGMIAITRNPQLYIDQLGGNILKHSMMLTNPRYWVSKSAGVSKDQFLDWKNALVEVDGQLSTDRLQPVSVPNLDGTVVEVMQLKIDELKETSGNRDVNSGSAGSGVTAAAAISALQEAGNKSSRDSNKTSYRCYARVDYKVIELMRQLYDETRYFRISGPNGGSADSQYTFMPFNNAGMKDQATGISADGGVTVRRPVFDIRIVPEKKNPYSQMTQNEYAKEFYQLGFFNPERAQETMIALSMMDFDGIDQVREQVQQGQTLYNVAQQQSQQIQQLVGLIGAMKGSPVGGDQQNGETGAGGSQQQKATGKTVGASAIDAAKTAQTPYQQTLAQKATPDMSAGG
jgi:hypothetical protein